jgi:adenine-specific DNA-methyltransferase
MSEMPERFSLASMDTSGDRIDALQKVFPEVFREGRIDFDVLRRVLGDWLEPGPERFGLTWPGKAECMRVIQEPSIGTLVPMEDDSVDYDATHNVIIEGDNLEVLKLLQKAYYGKVKLIYIDPPYNTGKEFIYPDNFKEGLADYLRYSGQVDEEGFRLSANAETDGRYHSKWLSMMYPRLFLARNLMDAGGSIFVTIDDTEVGHLRDVMDEIWGEENFVAVIAWQKVFAKKNKALVSGSHDHILVYAKDLAQWSRNLLPRDDEQAAAFKNPDKDPRGPWQSVSFSVQSEDSERRKAYRYEVTLPSGRKVGPPPGRHWNGLPNRYDELVGDNRIWFGQSGDNPPRVKTFLSEVQDGIVPDSWWRHEDAGNNQEAKKEILDLFGESEPFSTPKPTRLIRKMIQIATDKDSLVLDFFAGSGTTAHAVMAENLVDGGNRRCLLVQLPEATGRADYPTIASITRERVRRAAKSLGSELGSRSADLGFRAYMLAASNFGVWDSEADGTEQLADQLKLAVEHIVEGGNEASILTELLLKAGYPLTAPTEVLNLTGVTVYSVAGGALLVCLAGNLTIDLFEAMVEQDPAMILVLDAGFSGSDELKVNALQTVRARNQRTGSDIVLRVV